MTAKEWLGVMQKAQDFPKGMERLIEKYGEMLLKEQMQVNKNCVLPDVSNRRELLLAFSDFIRDEKNTQFIYTFWIDEFLSKQ